MKKLLLAWCLLVNTVVFAQYNAALVVQTPSIDFDSAVKLEYEKLMLHYPTDTGEGGVLKGLHKWANFWQSRISYDVSSGSNLLYPYFAGRLNYISNQGIYCNSDTNDYKGNWVCKGPFNNYYGTPFEQQGRVDAMWVDPDSPNHILAGACAGGLWRSRDLGLHWTNITDRAGSIIQGTIGVSGIAVNPLNEDDIYLSVFNEGAYGKIGDLGSNFGLGVVYTRDGGLTWYRDVDLDPLDQVIRVLFYPGTDDILVLLKDKLLIKDNPGYSGYSDITPGYITANNLALSDIELSKADPTKIVISTRAKNDTSHLFVLGPNIITSPVVHRKIGIPNFGQDDGLGGITDFSLNGNDDAVMICRVDSNNASRTILIESPTSTTPAITFLNRTGNLPVYKIEVSPSNPDLIYGLCSDGTRSFWKSVNGGVTFNQNIGNGRHADARALVIYSSTNTATGINDVLYGGTDGGMVLKSAGDSQFHSITGEGLNIMQFYNVAITEANQNYAMGASQDNGGFSYIKDRAIPWMWQVGGDNFGTAFGYADSTIAISESNARNLWAVKFNGNATVGAVGHPEPITDTCAGPNDILQCVNIQRPQYFNIANQEHIGVYSLWKKGWADNTWLRPIEPQPKDGVNDRTMRQIADFIISEKDSNIVYIAYRRPASVDADGRAVDSGNNFNGGRLFVSTNAYGTTPSWTNITPPVVQYWHIVDIEIDQSAPNRIWIALGGIRYGQADDENHDPDNTTGRVYYSNNYGAKGSWVDVSAGLPPLPTSRLLYLQGSNSNILFAGTDAGVFRWNNALSKWTCFNNGMPPCLVTDIKANYCANKLVIATFGRGMWESDLANLLATPRVTNITSNTTWNRTRFLSGSITVKSGNTLTITNNGAIRPSIHMPKNGKVTVEKGAQLVINNATITNNCSPCMWKGIVLEGDSAYQPANGKVTITNSRLQHAMIGIETKGGMITSIGSYYSNNSRAVYIHDFTKSPFPAGSRFTRDTFEVNVFFPGGAENYFRSHVELEQVTKAANFLGCRFLNNFPNEHWGTRTGIQAVNAGFLVSQYCAIEPCSDGIPSSFRGFRNGIWIESTGWDMPAKIHYTIFDSCGIGIRLFNSLRTVITKDTFLVGRGNEIDLNAFECNKNIGIYATGTEYPIIEENVFTGETPVAPSTNFERIGTLMENCVKNQQNKNYITVYGNRFDGLNKGCIAWGRNTSGHANGNINDGGLRYVCNKFTGSAVDIAITTDGTALTSNQGIHPYQQGEIAGISAGNEFSSGSGGHIANGAWHITYQSDAGANRRPLNTSTNVTIKDSTANTCPARFSNIVAGAIEERKGDLKDLHTSMGAVVASKMDQFTTLLDDGSTASMLAYLGTKNGDHAEEVYGTLMASSPWLSAEVLLAVAESDILSAESLTSILMANPEVVTPDFVEDLEALSPQPLGGEHYEILASAPDALTARTTLLSEIATAKAEQDYYGNFLMTTLLDEDTIDVDTVLVWYDHINTVAAEYAKASFLASIGEYADGETVLANLDTKFSLTTQQATDHSAYSDLYTMLKNVAGDNRTLQELNSTETGQLDSWEGNTSLGGIVQGPVKVIKDILTQSYRAACKYYIVDTYVPNYGDPAGIVAIDPNPATVLTAIDYQARGTNKPMITITPQLGGSSYTHSIYTVNSTLNKNLEGYTVGNYWIKLLSNGVTVDSELLVINPIPEITSVSPNPATTHVNIGYEATGTTSPQISLTPIEGGTPDVYNISAEPSSQYVDLEGYVPGTYVVKLISNSAVVDEAELVVNRIPFTANAGEDQVIDLADPVTLEAEDVGEAADYNWYDAEDNLLYTGRVYMFYPTVTATYKLEVVAESDNFSDDDHVQVAVKPFFITSVSPNPATSTVDVTYQTTGATAASLVITPVGGGTPDVHPISSAQSIYTVSLSGYTPGSYIITLVCDSNNEDEEGLIVIAP